MFYTREAILPKAINNSPEARSDPAGEPINSSERLISLLTFKALCAVLAMILGVGRAVSDEGNIRN